MENESTLIYKCKECGGELTWRPERQDFFCEYCKSEFTQEEIQKQYANVNAQAAQSANKQAETRKSDTDEEAFTSSAALYTCQNCGAQVIGDAQTSATTCYYCHAPVILTGRLTEEYRPEYILPFRLSQEQAIEKFNEWTGKRWFLPSSFSRAKREKISAVYVPFWLTNCTAYTQIQGIGKRIRSWREGQYEVTETQEFDVRRSGSLPYRGIAVDGAKQIDNGLMHAIEPFDYSQMIPFQMQYLSGFSAQKYDDTYEEIYPEVNTLVDDFSQKYLEEDVHGYTSFTIMNHSTNIYDCMKSYVLLPVWFLHYRYKGKDYDFAMNGMSGKVSGRLPLSVWKSLLLCVGIALIFFGISALIVGWLFS